MKTDTGNAGAQGAEASEAAGVTSLTVEEATARLLRAAGEEAEQSNHEGTKDTKGEGEQSNHEDTKDTKGEEEGEGEQSNHEGTEDATEEVEAGATEGTEAGKVEFSPEQQAILDREIGKKVAKHKEETERLTAQIEDLQKRVDEMASSARPAQAGNAGADLLALNAGQLDDLETKAQDMLDWCEEHADGYEADPEDKNDKNLSAEQVRKAKVQQMKLLREIPKVREMQRQAAEAEKVAVAEYPELKRGGADRRIYDGLCQVIPALKRLPNGMMLVGDMIAGERARQAKAEAARKAATGKTGKAAPVAPKLPGTGTGAKRPAVATAGGKGPGYTVAQMVADGGTVDAATRLMLEREKR